MKFHKNGEALRKISRLFLELILTIGNLSKLTALECRGRLVKGLLEMLNIRTRIPELVARDQIKSLAVYTPTEKSNKKINALKKVIVQA